MKGPSPCTVLTRSAFARAATNESCTPVDIATAAISTRSAGGISTLSMTWITPFDAGTSANTTVASPIITVPSVTVNEASSSLTIVTVNPSVTSAALTAPK